MLMREVGSSGIGRYLVQAVKRAGGMAEKIKWHRKGPPDYLVTWRMTRLSILGSMDLIETKAPGKKPRADQVRDHVRRRKFGVVVHVLDTQEKIADYVEWRCRYNNGER
jgi:hypothetical protein